jgi:hypothetical protein
MAKEIGQEQRRNEIIDRETPEERVINDLVDINRSLTGHMYAHKKAAMIQAGEITRKMLADANKSKQNRRYHGPVYLGD